MLANKISRVERPAAVAATVRLSRALFLLIFLAAFASTARAQVSNIIEYPIARNPVQSTGPFGITFGPDGTYWFCEFIGNSIGHVTTVSNNIVITEFGLTNTGPTGPLGTNASPFGIITGPDANMWFTEANSNKIARLNVSSNYTEFTLPTTNSYPLSLTRGPDGNIWFIEFNQNKIAAFNPFAPTNSGGNLSLVHEYGPFGTNINSPKGSPGTNAGIYGITTGPDGNIWFTMGYYSAIANVSTDGTRTNIFHLPQTNSQPASIITGPDAALWFTDFTSNQLGRITTTGVVTNFPLPTNPSFPTNRPYAIIVGNDGKLWFTEFTGSAVGNITTNGTITIFPTPTQFSQPTYLATGTPPGDTNIWFSEFPSQNFANGVLNDLIGEIFIGEALGLDAPTAIPVSGQVFNGVLAAFQNSNTNNTIVVGWGDGTTNSLKTTNSFSTTNSIVTINSIKLTNSLTITNTVPIGTNGSNGQFVISAIHNFPSLTNFTVSLTITDGSNDMAIASILLDTGITPAAVPLSLQTSGSNLVITWPGSGFNLLSAPTSAGPWSPVSGAMSPFKTSASNAPQFFRLRSQ